MPKAEVSISRAPSTKAKKLAGSRYQRAVHAVEELTPKERARLMLKLQKSSISPGRARLIREVKEAEEEFARGECFTGTVEEIMRELTR